MRIVATTAALALSLLAFNVQARDLGSCVKDRQAIQQAISKATAEGNTDRVAGLRADLEKLRAECEQQAGELKDDAKAKVTEAQSKADAKKAEAQAERDAAIAEADAKAKARAAEAQSAADDKANEVRAERDKKLNKLFGN